MSKKRNNMRFAGYRRQRDKWYYVNEEYASEYFDKVPYGYIDKTVCGCGLTTVALESEEAVVVAMPNVALIKNKIAQYPNDRCEYNVLGIFGGVTDDTMRKYYDQCLADNMPLKILVTYDSLWRCEGLLDECRLIIDESDRILANTKLKLKGRKNASEVSCIDYMLELAEERKDTVSFISATPIPLGYLPDWISEIDQVTIEWENTMTITPICMKRGRPLNTLKEEILSPLNRFGNISISGIEFSSVIVFINSVNSIKNAIKNTGINIEDVGIICANNLKNDIKISGIKRITDPANLPKYTFVTSSGFQGMDLYSKDAMTVIVSTTGNDFQMIDMKTDLRQATSRQRVKSNPTYGKYIYIYNQSVFESSEDKILETIENKEVEINSLCTIINSNALGAGEILIKYLNENKDFNEYTNVVNNVCSINDLSFNADKYFILETRRQYTTGFRIQSELGDAVEEIEPIVIDNVSYIDMVDYFAANNVNGAIDWKDMYNPIYSHIIEECYKKKGSVTKNYTRAYDIAYNMGSVDFGTIKSKMRIEIPAGNYMRKEIKSKLQKIYDTNMINRKAEWKDIYEAYKNIKLIAVNGKRLVRIGNS